MHFFKVRRNILPQKLTKFGFLFNKIRSTKSRDWIYKFFGLEHRFGRRPMPGILQVYRTNLYVEAGRGSKDERIRQISTVKSALAITCPLLLTTSTRHDPA